MERAALKLDDAEPVELAGAAPTLGEGTEQPPRRDLRAVMARWLAAHRGQIRALLLGALSLGLFLLLWHVLTKYRVNIYVRFLNVPSPEAVFEQFRQLGVDGVFTDFPDVAAKTYEVARE